MMYKKAKITIGFITILCAIILTALFVNNKDTPNNTAIKIGAILPMTGPTGFLGKGNKEALLLYSDKNPGVEFIFEDSKGSPRDGISSANKLFSQDVKYVITSLSYIVNTIQPIVDKKQALNFTLNMDPRPERKSKYCMRLYATMYQEMDALYQYAKQQNVKNIVVMYNNSESLHNAVENYLSALLKNEGIALNTESYDFGTKDFRNIIAKLSTHKAEVVRILDFGDKMPLIMKQISESNGFPNATIVSGLETLWVDFKQIPEDIISRFRFTAPRLLFYENNEFINSYKTKYGKTPTFDAAFSYDIAQILVPEIRANGYENVNKVIESIINQKQFSGVAANYSIDEFGGIGPELNWAIIRNGRLEFMQ